LGGQTKIFGGQRVVITDESIGIFQLLGVHAWGAPKFTPLGTGP